MAHADPSTTAATLGMPENFNAAIHRISDAIVISSGEASERDSCIVFANDVLLELAGYSLTQLQGRPLATLLEVLPPAIALLATHGDADSTVVHWSKVNLRRQDGSLLELEFHVTPLRDGLGNVVHRVITLRDTIERQSFACRLETLASSFETMQSVARVGSWITEQGDRNMMRCSKEMLDMFGLTQEEVERDPNAFIARFYPDDRERIARTFRTAIIERRGLDIQHRVLLPSGEVRWIHARATPASEQPGVPFRLVGVAFDISERVNTRDSLRVAEQRYHAAAEASRDGLVLFRSRRDSLGSIIDFEFVELNRRAIEFVTRDKKAIIGMGLCELAPIAKSHGYLARLIEVVESGTPLELTIPNESTEFKLKWARVQVVPLGDGLAVSVRDIGQERDIQARLSQTQRLESVGRCAAGIAHDFNNMLSAIMGFGMLARDASSRSSAVHDDIAQAMNAAERAAQLTRYLLAFSSRQNLEPSQVDISALVQDLASILSRLAGTGIQLSLDLEPSQQMVWVDQSQLEQAIVNLVANGRDAMPTGGQLKIQINAATILPGDLEATRGCVPGEYVRVSISDTGIGMEQETMDRMFDPFFTTKETGTGLGLASVYGFVKQSEGHIMVESELEYGTTLRIYLPRMLTTRRRSSVPAPRNPGLVERGTETVLLVESDESARTAARRILALHGYKVLDATNAGEAVLILEKHPEGIAVLLTALHLPRVNGIELAQRTRRQCPNIAIVLMSGAIERLDIDLATEALSAVFLQKPLTPERLVGHVRQALTRAQRANSPAWSEES